MIRVLHLVVGPDQHGVVLHAVSIARALGQDLLRSQTAAAVDVPIDYDVVHLPYTDGLFGRRCEEAVGAFERLAGRVTATGAALSVTLHDLPRGSDLLHSLEYLTERRTRAYRRVIALARGIVVSSVDELAQVERLRPDVHSLRVIPLPVTAPDISGSCERPGVSGWDVAVLGFVYPDRGYEQVIRELPGGCEMLAIGRAAEGHEGLPDELARQAKEVARDWQLTGFLPDEELSPLLRRAAVPVAPNRRVSASASIATWLAHGRRPLVADCDYTRELDANWPGAVRIYNAERPGDLRVAIQEALGDPDSTMLAPGVVPGPSMDEVAAAYRSQLESCSAPKAHEVGAGRFVVPDNRWDLLAGRWPTRTPTVSVVIPYYDSQRRLDLVLTGLALQDFPTASIEVIVADDGSARPPDVAAAGGLECRVVRQDDRGFRAAAARNLGAAAAEGDVLAFLDSDTIPEPEYLWRLTRLPALLDDALVVGRRRHADLAGWTTERLRGWFLKGTGAPRELTEPSWLIDGYRNSRDLLDVDSRSYRFIISAVAALRRSLFNELGGFSQEFTSYGGEDWELAFRAYNCGAVLAHVADAVAWHDGPEWAERNGDQAAARRQKEREADMLRRLLPDDLTRGPGQWMPYPAIVVLMDGSDAAGVWCAAQSAFTADADCGFWLTGRDAQSSVERLADRRIQVADPTSDVLDRARIIARIRYPADLSELSSMARNTEHAGVLCTPVGRFTATRAARRAGRHVQVFGDTDDIASLLFGYRDSPGPARLGDDHHTSEYKAPNKTRLEG